MEFRLEDLIAAFRALEANEDAIPILGDEDAMRCLAAWSKTDQTWTKPRGRVPTIRPGNHADVWAWIVRGWSFDYTNIATGAGLSLRIAHEKVRMLSTNRLIYPDGSMSKAARTALNIHVAEKLGIKQQAPGRKPAPKKRDDEGDDTN